MGCRQFVPVQVVIVGHGYWGSKYVRVLDRLPDVTVPLVDGRAERLFRRLADHGRSKTDRHRHDARGRNSRLDSLQADALSAKLALLGDHNERRRALMASYREQPQDICRPESVHYLAVVQTNDRPALTAALDVAGIGWGAHYSTPCHRQPAYCELADDVDLLVAEREAEENLSLPMSPTLTEAQIDRATATFKLV